MDILKQYKQTYNKINNSIQIVDSFNDLILIEYMLLE